MTDASAERAVFSVILPTTNSITEPDMSALRPPGVSNQSYRFTLDRRPDNVVALIDLLKPAITSAQDCQPDRLILGYTSEFLPNGIHVANQLKELVEGIIECPLTMASYAIPEALKAFGLNRIGVITPYLPEEDIHVEQFFSSLNFSVIKVVGLSSDRQRLTGTASITKDEVETAFEIVDNSDVEALVQIGTNLSCTGIVASLEEKHGKPVIAVNTATYWLALRRHGITDKMTGHGILLEQH